MRRPLQWLLMAVMLMAVAAPRTGHADDAQHGVRNLNEMFARLQRCWQPPALPAGDPGMEITVLVSFKRDGQILGRPRITFESRDASDTDRIAYRTAVMEALQRCVPMPFTEGMGASIAGHPMTLRFDDRRNLTKPKEKRAWLTTTTL